MAGRSDQSAMEAFVNENGVDGFTHLIDDDGSLWANFEISSQPAFVFINDDGTTTVHNGALGHDQLSERIEELRAT